MADVRTDDFIAEVEIRSDDMQHGKSIELFAHTFRINDETGDVDFVDQATREHLLEEIEAAMLLVAKHELAPVTKP